jgi:hypothetical protein
LGHPSNNPINWVDPSGLQGEPVGEPPEGRNPEADPGGAPTYEFPDWNINVAIEADVFGGSLASGDTFSTEAGTPVLPQGGGDWTPGADQTGDVAPSEAASFENCPFGRCAGPPQNTNLAVFAEAAGQIDDTSQAWETSLAIALLVTPGPGTGEGLILGGYHLARGVGGCWGERRARHQMLSRAENFGSTFLILLALKASPRSRGLALCVAEATSRFAGTSPA